MIKVVMLDIDNTLLSFDKFVIETMKTGFEKFGIGKYTDTMFDTFNRINTKLWHQIEKGELSLDNLKKQRWNMIFESLGMSYDGEEFEKYFRKRLAKSAIEVEGAMDILRYLHGKYIVCAASNGPYQQQVNRLKIGGMLPYFHDVFVSEDIGVSKPDKKFFDICTERLKTKLKQDIKPCEIIIIGDSLSSDMAGGIGYGMKTCFYNPCNTAVTGDIKPDYQVASLKKIKDIL